MKTILVLVFFTVLTPRAAVAQDRPGRPSSLFSWSGERQSRSSADAITTDRPDFTESAATVGLGVTQLEIGYTFASSGGVEIHSWGEPLIRHGLLADWLEFRIALAPVTLSQESTTSGFEDVYLGVKVALAAQQGVLPEAALVPQLTAPTGATAFTADRVLPGANLLYAWDLTEDLSLAGSTQYNRAVDDLLNPYDEWAQSATVGRSLTESVGSYLEWYAFFPQNVAGVRAAHYLNAGITYLRSGDLQFDVRFGAGLSEEAEDYFFGTGLSIRLR